jgi:WD40 repeat protein
VLAVVWSPDGARIASGGVDMQVQVWDAKSGTLYFAYTGHMGQVNAIAWSPDGSKIASGSGAYLASDAAPLQIWDAATGRNIFKSPGGANIQALAWSPDGTKVATAGADRTVQIWQAG